MSWVQDVQIAVQIVTLTRVNFAGAKESVSLFKDEPELDFELSESGKKKSRKIRKNTKLSRPRQGHT